MALNKKALLTLCNLLGIKQVTNKSRDQLANLIREYEEINTVKVIGNPETPRTIKYIYHSADIHIRVLERHQEYNEVFENLYNYFKSTPNCKEDSVFVIAGDIFHDRSKLLPETILLFNNFIQNLTNLIDVIIIAGNHDTFTHDSRIDIISGITGVKDFENFYYLKKSGIYKYYNLDIAVSSLIDRKVVKIDTLQSINKDLNLPENHCKVALFHGPVSGCKLDNGRTLNSSLDNLKVSDFSGFDITLLGDIHLRQHLTPVIAYPGSLIQQNQGEQREHGILKWDTSTKTSEFIKIDNDYGFITIDINNGTLPENLEFPKKSRVRVRHPYHEDINIEDIKKQLSDKTTILGITKEILPEISEPQESSGKTNKQLKEQTDTTVFQELIKEFPKETRESLEQLHQKYLSDYETESNSDITTVPWVIKSIEFKNIFIYGGDIVNKIDFKEGITGVLGRNASGKTSLMNTILYCLFGNVFKTKNFSNRNVINRNAKNFSVKMEIICGEYLYVIQKTGKNKTRKGGAIGMEETVTFTRIDSVGNEFYLTGATKADTVSIIHKTLCLTNKENFALTNVISYTNYNSLLSKTGGEISKTLGELFDIQKYKEIHSKITKKTKEISEKLRDSRRDFQKLEEESKFDIDETDIIQEKERISEELMVMEKEIEELNDTRVELGEIEDIVKPESLNPEEIQKFLENTHIHSELEGLTKIQLNKQLNALKNKNLTESLAEWSSEKIQETAIEIKNLEEITIEPPKEPCSKSIYQETVDYLKEELNSDEFIEDLTKITKTDEGTYNLSEDLYLDLLDFLSELSKTSESSLKAKLLVLEYSKYQKKKKEYREKCKSLEEKKKLLNNLLTSKKEDILVALEFLEKQELLQQINKYLKCKESQETLLKTEGLIKAKKLVVKQLQQKLLKINQELSVIEYKKKCSIESKKKLNLLEKEIEKQVADENLHKYYKSLLADNSLPKIILKEKIKKVEKFASILAYKLVGLTITLDTYTDDEEAKYEITAKKSGCLIGIDQISGFERFVINVALKIALDKYKTASGCRLFCIDESLDCVSVENLDKVDCIFEELRNYYHSVLVVSHNEDLKNKIDHRILIDTSKNYSTILSYI
jgi:DNA repair exonuclease SbcCD ATPase subunit/DNA repair exonuclease SbcCD nuclease subunit